MTEITERDPFAIRGRILKEFGKVQTEIATNPNNWRSVTLRAHKRIYEAMGYDYVDYPEFEFWFLRFLQGNFDWGYDRTSDPKPHSLTDLPSDVFNKISGNLNLEDRLLLRDVCNDFRAHVDNWDVEVDEIYYRNGNDWRVWETYGSGFLDSFGQNENKFCPDFYRDPISFVMNVLKHPKLQLEKLTIRREDKYWKKLIKRLDETNRKLYVKNVEFAPYYRPSEIDLHFLIPKVIEEIKLYLVNPKRKEVIEIIESEQCQKAKVVHIDSPTVSSQFPLQALYNCPRFALKLKGSSEEGLKAKFLKTLMNKGEVQTCVIYARRKIMKYFNEPEAMVPNFPSLRRYPIPGTGEFYQLQHQKEFVRLERKQ